MRILLIDPEGISKCFNIGLAYLGAALAAKNHAVKILDLSTERERRAERIAAAMAGEPDVVGVSLTTSGTFARATARQLVETCRSHSRKKCIFLAGGVGVSVDPASFLKENAGHFDYAVFGEGEESVPALIESIAAGSDGKTVGGTGYVCEGDVHLNEERPQIRDLDRLPFPDYALFDSFHGSMSAYPLITSRGCPFQCVFCLNSVLTKRKWRPRSPQNVLDELVNARERYGITSFEIWDDNFALDVERAEKICDMLIERKMGLPYTLPDGIRAASVTERLARKLKESGCRWVTIGVQDGNPDTYGYVETGEKLEDVNRAVRFLQDAGIPVMTSMVIGLPHTTFASTRRSMEYIKNLNVRAAWYLATPFKGTAFHDWVMKNGRMRASNDDEKAFSFRSVIFDTPEFPAGERRKAYYIANMEYSFPEKTPGMYPYDIIYYEGRNAFMRMINSIVIVCKYNPKRLPGQVMTVVFRILGSFFRRIKTGDFNIK